MKKGLFSRLFSSFKNEDYHSVESEKELYNGIIDGVINAKSGTDLKLELDKVQKYSWIEPQRYTFLMGLLQGALFQFNKEVSIKELQTLFKTI